MARCSHCEDDRLVRCSYADCPFEVEQAQRTNETLQTRITELEAEVERLKLESKAERLVLKALKEKAEIERDEALSRTGAVKVKTLEWHARPGVDGTFDAYTEIGHFIVTITDDERGMWFLVGITQSNYCEPDMGIVKAAAQADYERRILSALEPAAPDVIAKGLLSDADAKAAKLGKFGHHPDPAIDFEIEVESLQARLIDAKGGISKPGTEPEAPAAVLADIERAMTFRVGGDPSAVRAKQMLRDLEADAKQAVQPAAPEGQQEAVAWQHIPNCGVDRESKMVHVTGKVFCDPCIAPLVAALNAASIKTVASCCGHGHRPGVIVLRDGRELFIAKDFEEARKVDAAFPTDINGDARPTEQAVTEEWREIKQHVQPRIADGYTAVAISKPGYWLVKGPGPAIALKAAMEAGRHD